MHAAVFVDFENLIASLQNRAELTGHRMRDLAPAILDSLKKRLQKENCQMVLGRSYAVFDTYPGMEFAHDLALMGFEPQYVLVGPTGKNSADVQLAVDVCRVLFRRPDIEAIVIVSGDRDFIPIARQVLEENRELRLVAIPDATSGDLRMRVGADRFWNALDLLPGSVVGSDAVVPETGLPITLDDTDGHDVDDGETMRPVPASDRMPVASNDVGDGHDKPPRAAIVGHIPVTWRTGDGPKTDEVDAQLATCIDLIVKAQIRHGSREIWLSPFLKGPMSQHFSHLVHPERRALINELRSRGVIRIEERENQFADHPYSVIVLDEEHPLATAAVTRARKA